MMPLDDPTRSQIRSLREAGFYVSDICQRLGLTKSGERHAVQAVIDAMPRRNRYARGIEFVQPGSSHRLRAGNWA